MPRNLQELSRGGGILLAIIVALALCAASRAGAYTGGPQLFDPLGWDPRTNRAYFHNLHMDETVSFGAVYYFDLTGKHPERRVLVGWSRPDANQIDSLQNARLTALRRRLRPLIRKPWAALAMPRVQSVDTLVLRYDRVARYQVMVQVRGLRFEIVCYHHPIACLKELYAIPGKQEQICVLSFFGNPYDSEGETQVPVVVSDDASEVTHHVEWKRD